MTTPAIETRRLTKTYRLGGGDVHALRPLDIEIWRGEFVSIMGPSGSGKSTCLHLLGCLQKPTSGAYLLDGENVAALSSKALADTRNRRIGFLFQTPNLLPRMTALQNVELPLIYRGVNRRARSKAAAEALEAVGLADRSRHRPDQLSGGQAQRAAIARALVGSPSVLLADEPTGALDSETGQSILDLFEKLHDRGATIVLVTHDAEVARRARRVLQFLDGRVIDDERRG